MRKRLRFLMIAGLAGLALGVVVFLWRHPDGAGQFEYAFGIAPPSGVKDIHAYRRYAGGPGDTFVLLQFTADRAAIDTTVACRPLEVDPNIIDNWLWRDNDVKRLWRSVFSTYPEYGGEMWEAPSNLLAAEVYEWMGSHPKLTWVKLLWDARTGKAYALYTIG